MEMDAGMPLSIRQSQHETPITIAITFVVIEDDDMHLSLAMYGGRDGTCMPVSHTSHMSNFVTMSSEPEPYPSLVSPVQRHTLEPTARLITSWTPLPSSLSPLSCLFAFSCRYPAGCCRRGGGSCGLRGHGLGGGGGGGNLLRGHSIPLARGIPMISPAQPARVPEGCGLAAQAYPSS